MFISSSANAKSTNESGAIIVLVAIMSIALMVLVGLIVDLGKLSTSKTAHEHTADMIALAMMESYSTQSPNESVRNRIEIAAQRASQVARENLDSWAANAYLTDNENGQGDLISINSVNPVEGFTEGENGKITPGFWFFEKPVSCSEPTGFVGEDWMIDAPDGMNCPCGFSDTSPGVDIDGVDADGWKGGCFKAIDISHAEAVPNAFKVELKTKDSSKIQSTFSNAIPGSPAPSFGLKSVAIAAIVPRNVLVAMDISPSITEETHDLLGQNWSTYGDYAFEVAALDNNSQPFGLGNRPSAPTNLGDVTCQVDYSAGFPGIAIPEPGSGDGSFGPILCQAFSCLNETYFESSPANTITASSTAIPTQFCPSFIPDRPRRNQADYQAVSLNTTDGALPDFGNPAFAETTFLIDSLDRPEPLASLLMGVNQAMETFEDRGTGADHFGFVAFDDDILQIRSTLDDSSQPALVKTGTPEFERFLLATDYDQAVIDHPNDLSQRPYIQNLLFPRRYSGESFNKGERGGFAQSNLSTVLRRAFDVLKDAPNADFAASSLVLFTDGMSSCTDNRCDTSLGQLNRWSVFDIAEFSRDMFVPEGITINIFLIGRDVAPHTTVRANGNGIDCMTDAQSRERNGVNPGAANAMFVHPYQSDPDGVYDSRSPTNPYFYPNFLYRASRFTGGSWLPLRPPCRDTDGDVFTDIQDQLNSECAGLPNNRKVQDFGAPVLAFDGTTTLYDRSVDDQARLLCDPKGRDLTSQVEEEMEKLLRKSPYLLVSERPN